MDAQNRFGQLLDTVQREPVTITPHGRTAAFIISPRDMQDLQNARRKRSAAVEAWMPGESSYLQRPPAAVVCTPVEPRTNLQAHSMVALGPNLGVPHTVSRK
jgi:prevent-host-death family protein